MQLPAGQLAGEAARVVDAAGLEKPVAVLNLGGVANVTFIGSDDSLMAFDAGPGNALIDDWMRERTGREFDEEGRSAAQGKPDEELLAWLLEHPFFRKVPPKSLDRDDFDLGLLSGLGAEDGAATLTAFTARAAALSARFLPAGPRRWLVTGGGRRNASLMAMLARELQAEVAPVEAVGWNGDALEAQAFAYLAVRSLRGLPLSLPTTTGVACPQTGGRRHRPKGKVAAHP